MIRRASRFFLFSTLLALGVSASRAQTNTIFIPKEMETAFGSRSADVFGSNENIQQVYAATEFSSAPADILKITEIAFRAEETQQATDSIIKRLVLHLNVFPGTMEDVVREKFALVPPLTRVFDRQNVSVATRADGVDAFDTRFILSPPFSYDRRKGQLVLLISHPDNFAAVASLDMQSFLKGNMFSFDRGAMVYPANGWGEASVTGSILATRFTYTYGSAKITGISITGESLQITFDVAGELLSPAVEQAGNVTGPYSSAENVELVKMANGSYQATIPLSGIDSFFGSFCDSYKLY